MNLRDYQSLAFILKFKTNLANNVHFFFIFKLRENLNSKLVNSHLVIMQLKIYLKYKYLQRLTHFFKDLKKVADIICSNSVDKERYRIGYTKIFFRSGVLGYMEELRDDIVQKLICYIQGACRGYLRRKDYATRKLQR